MSVSVLHASMILLKDRILHLLKLIFQYICCSTD